MALALLSGLCALSVALAVIPDPENITVVSHNLGVIVQWDYPREWHDKVNFTAQYRGYLSDYKTVCSNQTIQSCDFTTKLHHFGTYVFKVRAELNGEVSNWINISEFSIDKQSTIGPPSLTLYSKNGDIEVDLQDPVLRISTMKEVYNILTYNVTFWKEGQEKVKTKKNTEQTRLMLHNLEPWTNYCVQAQVYVQGYKKNGELSEVVCKATTSNGKVKPWVVAVVLVVSFLTTSAFVLLIFVAGWFIYQASKFFYPNAKLPEHFKQYINEPCHYYIFMSMQNSPQQKEVYHPVTILSDEAGDSASISGELQGVEESAKAKMGMEKNLPL
ncbi:interleukin-10 receptor subunit beta-like [Arapaima gigas]